MSPPALGDLLDPGIATASPVSPALAGGFFTTEPPGNLEGMLSFFPPGSRADSHIILCIFSLLTCSSSDD